MKLSQALKLSEVFVKKGRGIDTSQSFKIIGLDKSKSGKTVYFILENGRKFKCSDLTDVSCNLMLCGNCKYHKKESI